MTTPAPTLLSPRDQALIDAKLKDFDPEKEWTGKIPMALIYADPQYQPREGLNEEHVHATRDSMQAKGQDQAIVLFLNPDPNDPRPFCIASGFHRHSAAGLLKWRQIKAEYRPDIDTDNVHDLAFRANAAQHKMSLAEELKWVRRKLTRLEKTGQADMNDDKAVTQALATASGKTRKWVNGRRSLLNATPAVIQAIGLKVTDEGHLMASFATLIAQLPAEDQDALLSRLRGQTTSVQADMIDRALRFFQKAESRRNADDDGGTTTTTAKPFKHVPSHRLAVTAAGGPKISRSTPPGRRMIALLDAIRLELDSVTALATENDDTELGAGDDMVLPRIMTTVAGIREVTSALALRFTGKADITVAELAARVAHSIPATHGNNNGDGSTGTIPLGKGLLPGGCRMTSRKK